MIHNDIIYDIYSDYLYIIIYQSNNFSLFNKIIFHINIFLFS